MLFFTNDTDTMTRHSDGQLHQVQVSYASCRLILDRSPPDRCSPSTYTSHLHRKLINNCRQTSLRFEVVDTSTRDRRGELLSHRNELHCMAPSCGRLCILIPPSQIQSRLSSAAGFILRVRIGDAVKRNLSKASFDVVSVLSPSLRGIQLFSFYIGTEAETFENYLPLSL